MIAILERKASQNSPSNIDILINRKNLPLHNIVKMKKYLIANPKSLQNITNAPKTAKQVLKLTRVTQNDLKQLSIKEHNKLNTIINFNLNNLKNLELDMYINKVSDVVSTDVKNALWGRNHIYITNSIHNYIEKNGIMPPVSEIAIDTKISRQSIYKHLKEWEASPQNQALMSNFKILKHKVIAKVTKMALNGNMKAAKLYFDVVSPAISPETKPEVIQTQNNYIQINGTIISQDILKNLQPAQLDTIENIFKSVSNLKKNIL